MNSSDLAPRQKTPDADSDQGSHIHMSAHHVWQLRTRFPDNFFNVYLVEDVLIDAASRWDASSLLKQLVNIPLSQVALTHCHPDHQGQSSRSAPPGTSHLPALKEISRAWRGALPWSPGLPP
nr:MBL fold metallo-hydrolase [Ktedonobacter sp. SOSP1-52]